MRLNDTPRGDRLHIGVYGKRNSGKSSLVNALTGQEAALVSPQAGTTTDPVFKAMELHPIGPVMFIDTAGFDDEGELGVLRVNRTKEVLDRTDVAIMVINAAELAAIMREGSCQEEPVGMMQPKESRQEEVNSIMRAQEERQNQEAAFAEALADERWWLQQLEEKAIPVIIAVNKMDLLCECAEQASEAYGTACRQYGTSDNRRSMLHSNAMLRQIAEALPGYRILPISAARKEGMEELRREVQMNVPEDFLRGRILGDLIPEGGLAMLVMPQDLQAPKGRLILPQVQTLRELLDRRCTTVATTADGLEKALDALKRAPNLIITDSQCFGQVYELKPAESALTSFSVLFAAYKGELEKFLAGASLIDEMTEKSRVLIAEACTHVPLEEDIGRVKLPRLLRKRLGDGLEIVNVCGDDFPGQAELKGFDLIIHCGACMFNRKHVLSRIAAAEAASVPITNYGIILAKLAGILDKITMPE